MQTIYLSAHLDDVALSCGGLVWQDVQAGEQVNIWTICAGNIPPGPLSDFALKLHKRWQTGRKAVKHRRQEDIASCGILGAGYRHFSIPDCIYRFTETEPEPGKQAAPNRIHLYDEDTFLGPIHPAEEQLIDKLVKKLNKALPDQVRLISPLAIGGHVDHRLVRKVAEKSGRELLYFADYPYCVKEKQSLNDLEEAGWAKQVHPISSEALHAWQESIAAHASQISTFWSDLDEMAEAIEDFHQHFGGGVLWESPEKTEFV